MSTRTNLYYTFSLAVLMLSASGCEGGSSLEEMAVEDTTNSRVEIKLCAAMGTAKAQVEVIPGDANRYAAHGMTRSYTDKTAFTTGDRIGFFGFDADGCDAAASVGQDYPAVLSYNNNCLYTAEGTSQQQTVGGVTADYYNFNSTDPLVFLPGTGTTRIYLYGYYPYNGTYTSDHIPVRSSLVSDNTGNVPDDLLYTGRVEATKQQIDHANPPSAESGKLSVSVYPEFGHVMGQMVIKVKMVSADTYDPDAVQLKRLLVYFKEKQEGTFDVTKGVITSKAEEYTLYTLAPSSPMPLTTEYQLFATETVFPGEDMIVSIGAVVTIDGVEKNTITVFNIADSDTKPINFAAGKKTGLNISFDIRKIDTAASLKAWTDDDNSYELGN